MAKLTHVEGDVIAGAMKAEGGIILPHIVNNIGLWGKGFVVALSDMWPIISFKYKLLVGATSNGEDLLGHNQTIMVRRGFQVINMFAQRGVRGRGNPNPISYGRLQKCLTGVSSTAFYHAGSSVHMPKIGSGLAGGDWEMIEKMVFETIVRNGTDVVVYTLPK